jgi:hypothetical protein
MPDTMDPVEYPELIFATAGPIGVDMDTILSALKSCLAEVSYASEPIKLSAEMERIPSRIRAKPSVIFPRKDGQG